MKLGGPCFSQSVTTTGKPLLEKTNCVGETICIPSSLPSYICCKSFLAGIKNVNCLEISDSLQMIQKMLS